MNIRDVHYTKFSSFMLHEKTDDLGALPAAFCGVRPRGSRERDF